MKLTESIIYPVMEIAGAIGVAVTTHLYGDENAGNFSYGATYAASLAAVIDGVRRLYQTFQNNVPATQQSEIDFGRFQRIELGNFQAGGPDEAELDNLYFQAVRTMNQNSERAKPTDADRAEPMKARTHRVWFGNALALEARL